MLFVSHDDAQEIACANGVSVQTWNVDSKHPMCIGEGAKPPGTLTSA